MHGDLDSLHIIKMALLLYKKGLIQLYQTYAFNMERVMGIEPTLTAWKAVVLPLNYTRDIDGREDRI